MRILALDTSGASVSVAVLEDRRIIFEAFERTGHTHSARLLTLVESSLMAAGWTMGGVDRLAVTLGPGSYTGVRIGVTTARGLAQGVGIPCVGLDTLEVLAARTCGLGFHMVCTLLDARAGQVYGALFDCAGDSPVRLLDDTACSLDELWMLVRELDRVVFVGDGAERLRDRIVEKWGERAMLLLDSFNYPHASAAGLLAADRQAVTFNELLPIYLRAPQAERDLLARSGS
ncbi:tRNA (adenosine(37)-N6)-threonylcarbamoyltransferase complex dimerization subunit type 1 TsaB [Clostridia bacterium]|nr:tRNA (adenosine(37)-N6)-threonylcarbamoyltransferase complex dimerization subunit type 1 TsaB [Clostridia bacterium]